MAEQEKSKYKLRGSRTPGEKTDQITLSGDRVLVLNGDSIELSDAEHDRLSKDYVLHKTSGPSKSDDDSKPNNDKNEKGGE